MLKLVAFVLLFYAFEGLSQSNHKGQRQGLAETPPKQREVSDFSSIYFSAKPIAQSLERSPVRAPVQSSERTSVRSSVRSPIRSLARAHLTSPSTTPSPKTPTDIIAELKQELKDIHPRKESRLSVLRQERAQLRKRLEEADGDERSEIQRLLREKNVEIMQVNREAARDTLALTRRLRELKNSKEDEWHYKNCEEAEDPPFIEVESETEAGFCANCSDHISNLVSSLDELKNFRLHKADQQWPEFKERLRKRALGLVAARLSHIQFIKACVTGDETKINKLSQKIKDLIPETYPPHQGLSDGKAICEAEVNGLKDSITGNFKDMKISLALSSADKAVSQARTRRRGMGIDPSDFRAYMDPSPSHKFWDFDSLPSLSPKEQEKARDKYIEDLFDKLENDEQWKGLDKDEFRELVLQGKTHPGFASRRRSLWISEEGEEQHLNDEDREKLRDAVQEVAKDNLHSYQQALANHPILGWVQDAEPSSEDLADALTEMESRIAKFAEELQGEDLKDGFLLSFEALTEDLLNETAEEGEASPYCLAVEKARLKAEKEDGGLSIGLLLATGAVALPCFFAAPIIGLACLAGGIGLTAYDLHESNSHLQQSLGHLALSGKNLERLGDLSPRVFTREGLTEDMGTGQLIRRREIIKELMAAESSHRMSWYLAPLFLLDAFPVLRGLRTGVWFKNVPTRDPSGSSSN